MTKQIGLTLLIILTLAGCSHPGAEHNSIPDNKYARGFTISDKSGVTLLRVRNPWEKAKNIEFEYYLIDKSAEIPPDLKTRNIIRTPVESIICMSTTHLAFLDKLGEIESVTGISGAAYVSNPRIMERFSLGEITDIGYGMNINYEEIIRRKPDVVMLYGVDSEITGILRKFGDLGIPVVLNAEYLEADPLGKAEWIKVAGALYNKSEMADSLFRSVEASYNKLKELAATDSLKPKVLMGMPYREVWWVPGGESYMARMIKDAGGDYLGRNNSSHESYVISFEEALVWSGRADIWINAGMVHSKRDILEADERFAKFRVFQEGRIYNNNNRTTGSGGVDFWESGVMAPEVILADLIQIFHPGLLKDHKLYYYKEIR